METKSETRHRKGRIKITKEGERTFFFYATVAMFVLWVYLELFGG
jgi:hypothetical protein